MAGAPHEQRGKTNHAKARRKKSNAVVGLKQFYSVSHILGSRCHMADSRNCQEERGSERVIIKVECRRNCAKLNEIVRNKQK